MTGGTDFATEQERVLAGIWSEVLDTSPIDRDDHFFAIGGNSMSALRVTLAAADEGWSLAVRDLFLHPVLADLAAVIASAAPAPAPVHADDSACYPALRMQVGMLFESERDPDRPTYHVVSETEVELMSEPTLTASVRRVVDAQPGLRTAFVLDDDRGPQQVVRDVDLLPLRVDDLSESPPATAAAAVVMIRDEERGLPFDRDDFPLWRLRAVALPHGQMRLFLSHHHAVLDGWSVAVFVDQVLSAARGRPVALPSAVGRAATAAEARALASPATGEYWSAVASRWRGLDVTPRVRSSAEPVVHTVTWPSGPRDREDVERACARWQCSARHLFLAVHLRALESAEASGRFGGRGVHATGSGTPGATAVVNARPEVGGAPSAVGMFLNAVPVLAPEAGASWRARIDHVVDQETATQQHRHFPHAAMRSQFGLGAPTTWFTFTDFRGTSLGGFLDSVVDHNITELPLTISVVDDGLVVDASTEYVTLAEATEFLRWHVGWLGDAVRAAADEEVE